MKFERNKNNFKQISQTTIIFNSLYVSNIHTSIKDYSVVSIKRTGSLNYFEVFSHPVLFFHVLKKNFAPPCSFFHVLKKIFAPPCSLITSCSLNRYYRVVVYWTFSSHRIRTQPSHWPLFQLGSILDRNVADLVK